MRELQQRQKIKKRLYSLPALAILFIITILVVRGTYGIVEKQRESAMHVEELKAKVASLSLRQKELSEDISRLKTDEGIDTEIKTKFNVSKEGEHVAVIVDPSVEDSSSSATTSPWYKKAVHKLMSLW